MRHRDVHFQGLVHYLYCNPMLLLLHYLALILDELQFGIIEEIVKVFFEVHHELLVDVNVGVDTINEVQMVPLLIGNLVVFHDVLATSKTALVQW